MNDLSGIPGGQVSLVERIKAILLNPKETWPAIAGEAATPGDLITRYAIPLAAIGPVAGFIGGQLFGINAIFATYKPGLMAGLATALFAFLMAIAGLIIMALVVDFLAPKFEGQANRTQAFKLCAYSLTAGWVAGILGLIPSLGMLGILAALYGIYLFYLGATPVMKVPEAKVGGFTAVTIVVVIVVYVVLAAVTAPLTAMFGGGLAAQMAAADDSDVEVNIPGLGKIEGGKLEEAGKQLEAASKGEVKPVDIAALQALLPASVGGMPRTALETNAIGQMGKGVEATYEAGGKRVEVSIIDSAGLGALAGLGAAMGVEQSREDADSYERTSTEGGQMQVEEWNKASNHGSYTRQIAGRFMVKAEGDAGSIDELKAVVASIDAGSLAGLAE
jgi:Yip1 domain